MNGNIETSASNAAQPTVARGDAQPPGAIWRYVVWVFVLALVLRLAWCTFATVTPISDCAGYNALAHELLQTGRFYYSMGYAWRTPAYPGFIAGVYATLGDDVRAVALAQAFLGAFSAAAVVLLAGQVAAPRAGLLAGLLLAVWPTAIVYTPVLVTENLATPLLLLLLLCVAWAGRTRRGRAIALVVAAGALFGLLLLTRPSNCFFAPAIVILLCRDWTQRKWRPWFPVVFVVATLAVLSPWLIRNYRMGFGPFTLSTQGGMSMWWGNNPQTDDGASNPPRNSKEEAGLDERGLNHLYSTKVMTWLRENPRRYLTLCGVRAIRFLGKHPDWFAAKFAWPTPDNDLAVRQRYAANSSGLNVPKERLEYARALENRLMRDEERLRCVMAPLLLLALLWSLFRWRVFALVSLPLVFYAGGLSLTVFVERYRAVSDPLFLIVLAALLSDIVFGTRYLGGGRGWRLVKAVLAIVVVAASLYVNNAGFDKKWYSSKPPPMPRTAPADTQGGTAQRAVEPSLSGGSGWTVDTDVPNWASVRQLACAAEGPV